MYSWKMKSNYAVKQLAALAHEGRLGLFRHLINAGPEGVIAGELARVAEISATTASGQLLVLTNAGLVESKREGRQVRYYIDFTAVTHLLCFLLQDCCGNRSDICADVLKACSS